MIDEIILNQGQELSDRLITYRRHLHKNPELSFQEENTAAYLSTLLSEYHIPHKTSVGGHGIVAHIQGQLPGKSLVALRADMDALPLTENTGLAFASEKVGIMHACGHDIHMSSLLGASIILNNHTKLFGGSVRIIFQPAEEKIPGGAKLMIEAGVLENPVPDLIIGQHVFPELEVGKLGFRAGPYMASSDEINIHITGGGGHAALPDQVNDTVYLAAEIITSLQKVVSRKAPPTVPTVLSFGKIVAEGAHNVIPEEVQIMGTFRTFDEAWRSKAHQLIQDITHSAAKISGANVEIVIERGYPFLVNDEAMTRQSRLFAEELFGKDQIVTLDRRMTAEDFAYYSHEIPAVFYRLGTGTPGQKNAGLHTPDFQPDERSLSIGAASLAYLAIQHLNAFNHDRRG